MPSLPEPLRAALEASYREVTGEVASLGAACWARGDCCDFERCDHRLYASSVEIAYVAEVRGKAFAPGSALCPFWREGKCTERERRPLGCRTYFCDRRFKEALEEIHERHYQRLRRAAQEHGFQWTYEPFVSAMRQGEQAPGGAASP